MQILWRNGIVGVAALAMLGPSGCSPSEPPIEIVPQVPHSEHVPTVAWSHDGKLVVSGSWDSTIKLWDAESGRLLRTFTGHKSWVNAVAFTPDGARIVSGSSDRALRLWDAATGRAVRSLDDPGGRVDRIAVSPDGIHAASASGGRSIRLWNLTTGALVRTIEDQAKGTSGLAFSPDGMRLVTSDNAGTVDVWEVASGKRLLAIAQGGYEPTFAPDGAHIVARDNRAFKLHDASTGELIRTINTKDDIGTLAVSPDGSRIASGASAPAMWDANSGALLPTFRDVSYPFVAGTSIASISFSPDGTRVLFSYDGIPQIRDAASGKLVRLLAGRSASVASISASADGTRLVSGPQQRVVLSAKEFDLDVTIKLWDPLTGRLLRNLGDRYGTIKPVAISPDGSRILSADGRGLVMLNTATGDGLRIPDVHANQILTVAYASDGVRIASAGSDGVVVIRDAVSGAPLAKGAGHVGNIHALAFARASSRLVSGGRDGTVRFWDSESGALVRSFGKHDGPVLAVAISPDGARVASGSGDDTQPSGSPWAHGADARLWDAVSGALLHTLKGHTHAVSAVAFSPDSARLLTGSYDQTIRVWDSKSGALVRTLEGHTGGVTGVLFSSDGARIISGSQDTTIKIWSAQSGRLLATLLGTPEGEWAIVTPEGHFNGTGARLLLSAVQGTKLQGFDEAAKTLSRSDWSVK